MDTRRFTVGTALTLVAAYLGLFVGLIDANAINLALPAVRTDLGGGIAGARARAARLRSARTCYDHLAGRLGVQIMSSLLERKVWSAVTDATTLAATAMMH
jgi:hypothetical protein